MRKPESLVEKLWRSVPDKRLANSLSRYRGVLLVVSMPVILVLAIISLVPRHSPLHIDKAHTLGDLQHHHKYAIVFDAGSTGSRIHVFKFAQDGGALSLISDTFEQLKPGLSSFADDPQKAAASLQPLIDTALKTVPKELQASTPVSLKATAGLRLLPGDKSDKILKAVEDLLKAQPFVLNEGAVSIMDGKDEGSFAWLTLNYLLGKLDGGAAATVAAIDMGGGSIQEAFALTDADAKMAPAEYVTVLKGAGKTFNVYVHSYLSYGLMAGRAKFIEAGAGTTGHTCFPKGAEGKYAYAGKEYSYSPSKDAKFNSCSTVGSKALDTSMSCGKPQAECSFNGAWRGNGLSKGRDYFISSYFWDRALETGIISDKAATMFETTPEAYGQMAAKVCDIEVPEVPAKFPSVAKDAAPFLCLDLTYCHTMLTKGFQLDPKSSVTLVKQVEYNGQKIEAAWPLGAAINDLSA